MKKLFIVLSILLVLVAGGAVFLATQLDGIVARLIEEHGSAATGTRVDVGGVSIDVQDASGSIASLSVANPAGFDGPAIELDNFAIRIAPSSVTADTIVLENVTVQGARLAIVQRGGANNLQQILDNLRAGGDSAGAAEGESGRKLVIERFVLAEASASVSAPDLDEMREVDLPTITLTGIGRASNGATGAEVARQILVPVIERALRSAAVESFKDRAREKIDEVTDRLLDSIGSAEDEPPE